MPQKMRRTTPAFFAAGTEYLAPDDDTFIFDTSTGLPALIRLIENILAAHQAADYARKCKSIKAGETLVSIAFFVSL